MNQIISEYDDVLTDAVVSGSVSVGTSQVEAKASTTRLSNREYLLIRNLGSKTIYAGPSGVTASTGIPIYKDELFGLPLGNVAYYLITSTSTATVIIQEFA
jgi:hypothetical protein